MDSRQANKKLRLSTGASKNYFTNRRCSPEKAAYSTNNYDDDDLWGEELAVDDDEIQRIETQGYSQYSGSNLPKPELASNVENENADGESSGVTKVSENLANLQMELRTKTGEITNLRMDMENKIKEFRTQMKEKDEVIEDLKKQLLNKQSEIEFQKIEKLSQIRKTPKSSNSKSLSRPTQNLNNSFHEKFIFGLNKTGTMKDVRIFSFGNKLHQGDILFKFLEPALSSKSEIELSNQSKFNEIQGRPSELTVKLSENEFAVYLESCLLQLCRFHSFDQLVAYKLIKLIICRSNEILLRFHHKLSQKDINSEIVNQKPKIITLPRTKDMTNTIGEQSLLTNTKLYPEEKEMSVRQMITTIAKLLQVEPTIAAMLIETECKLEVRCGCVNHCRNRNVYYATPVSKSVTISQDSKVGDGMECDPVTSNRNDNLNKREFVFDAVELLHDVVHEITIREKSSKYEGIFCSILHLYSVLCNCDVSIYEKQAILIIRSIKKILFSLPGFAVIHYIIEFLSATTHYNFSDSLCCRSGAETFTENFRSISFTRETCMLQVLCAYLEMIKKSPYLINLFISWISSLTTVSHKVKWMQNKTDSKFCECLLMLEQISVKIVLTCIEIFDKSDIENHFRKLLTKHAISIFQQFRWQDADFDLHMNTCRGEYKMLLKYLRNLNDDFSKKFITCELEVLDDNSKHNLTPQTKNEVIESMLKLFSEDDNF